MDRERRILLTGATGQVGWELHRTLSPLGKVLAPDRNLFDLSRPDQMRRRIREWKPDLIVNPAAYTAVDQAESDHEEAFRVNAEAPKMLAEEASRLDIPLLHYSTDYVFNGEKSEPYDEEDEPDPLNVYGESKLAGERYVQENTEQHLIFRTSWVFGMRGKNFLTTMLRLFQEREEIGVVDDQIGTPTWSRMVAEATAIIVGQVLNQRNDAPQWGLYHMAASGRTNWYNFACSIYGLSKKKNDSLSIEPVSSDKYPVLAIRPDNSRLDSQKIRSVWGISVPDWEYSLQQCLEELVKY